MRIWVTRDEEPGGSLSSALLAAGLEPVLEPVIARKAVDDCRAVLQQLTADDWLVLTSRFAIEAVAPEPARVPRVAVVGERSRQAAEDRGLRVELVAQGGRDTLWPQLRARAHGGTLCYPRSSEAPAPRGWPGVTVISPVLYETFPRPFDRGVIERVDVVTVASPSAVSAIGALELPFASIGPTTSEALRRLRVEPWVEAAERSFESLAAAIAAKRTS